MTSALPLRTSASTRRPSLASVPSFSTTRQVSGIQDALSLSTSTRDRSASFAPSHNPSNLDGVVESEERRKRKKLRPQYPVDSEEKHVEYILVASFDIDRGSVMEHQYPAPIGGDEHMLAELMLPDQAHVRSQDWTIFFLHKDNSAEEELQERKEARLRRKEARAERRHAEEYGEEEEAHDDDDNDEGEEEEEEEEDALQTIHGPPLVYVLNLVNTKQDNTVKRGAVVKAMAICTRHSFLHIYKPLLLLALEDYFRSPVPETLATLYEAVNSMDLSLLPRLSLQERFILQASDIKDLFIEKFEAMVQQQMAADRSSHQSQMSNSRQQRYGLPRDTHEFECVVPYNKIPVPIKIPTAPSVETVGDFSLIKLIQTFSNPHASAPQPFAVHHPHLTTSGTLTHPIIVLMNALLTQKRIIFIGHNLPSSEVAEAVLAACALASGGMLRGFTRHAFPYTDLTKIDDLLKVPGFIAGVTNPTFTHKTEWWDLLCDLPTGRMKISPKIEQTPLTEGMMFFQQLNGGLPPALLNSGGMSAAGSANGGGGAGSIPTLPSATGDPTGDIAFMTGVLASIAERRGEGAVRARFRLWIMKFIRLAAAFEEMVYGASALSIQFPAADAATTLSPTTTTTTTTTTTASAPQPRLDVAVTGHGYVWPSHDHKLRELAANATRIEGWTKTRSYYNFVQDFAVVFTLRPIQDLDLQHLHDKLTKLRLGPDAAAAIYLAVCARVQTYEQVNQLLSVVVYASAASLTSAVNVVGSASGGGGLFHLALGLFHPRVEVREAVAELLSRIRAHEAGRHFWNMLGRFEKAAWERVVVGRQEREEGSPV